MPPRSHSNRSITSIGLSPSPSYPTPTTPSTPRAPLSSFRSTQEPKRPLRMTSSTHDEIDLSDAEDLKKTSKEGMPVDGTGKKLVGGPRVAASAKKRPPLSVGMGTPGKAAKGKEDVKGKGRERVTVCVRSVFTSITPSDGRRRWTSRLTQLSLSLLLSSRAKPSSAPIEDRIYDCDLAANTIGLGSDHPTTTRRGGVTKGREDESKFSVGTSSRSLSGMLDVLRDVWLM